MLLSPPIDATQRRAGDVCGSRGTPSLGPCPRCDRLLLFLRERDEISDRRRGDSGKSAGDFRRSLDAGKRLDSPDEHDREGARGRAANHFVQWSLHSASLRPRQPTRLTLLRQARVFLVWFALVSIARPRTRLIVGLRLRVPIAAHLSLPWPHTPCRV